jgi:hypothetical protein
MVAVPDKSVHKDLSERVRSPPRRVRLKRKARPFQAGLPTADLERAGSHWRARGAPGRCLVPRAALLGEAVAAIDRLAARGLEGHLGLATAR